MASDMKSPKTPLSTTHLVALCSAVYFTSYLTRKCYEASILAICDDTGLARTTAGLGGTALVALYGGGQFVTGWMADRINPRRIVLAALLLTAACNAAVPVAVATGAASIIAINGVNGFAQAMFWPPLVKIFADSLDGRRYKGAVFAVNVAANAAIVAVFALVSGCVRVASWRWSFGFAAAAALAMAAAWARSGKNSRRDPETQSVFGQDLQDSRNFEDGESSMFTNPQCSPIENTDASLRLREREQPCLCASAPLREKNTTRTLRGMAFLVPVILAIVCMGSLRDGIEAWAPTIVSDLYGLGTSGSTFSVALLPLFAVGSMAAARALRRALGDEIRAALALFALGFACAAALLASHGGSLTAGLPLIAILSASMHGANLMLVCELPGRFAASGRVGTISGILNSGVYLGAALSIYGFAALRERFSGWTAVFALWTLLLLAAAALCAAAMRCGMRKRC
ncbi:MAG: MFS transporter [Kiritimatiellae bacterium]|nr:MFS transporter [Kiritimatiellia bacterium]